MTLVRFGKHWNIETVADYEKAMETLADNEFCANMSDDYNRTWEELGEIQRQRRDVITQAKAKNII